MPIMKILVTGGFGFIGSHLIEALVARGYDVRILDIKTDCYYPDPAFKTFLCSHSVEVIKGDICEFDTCVEAAKDIDIIFHTAAVALIRESYKNSRKTFNINVNGTENILKAAVVNKVKRIVYSSTGKMYGNSGDAASKETSPIIPMTPYAQTKFQAEQTVAAYANDYGLNITSLRYFSVYGPRMLLFGGLIGDILNSAIQGDGSSINAVPSMARDFTYVEDLVNANLLCLEKVLSGYEVFNIASGVTKTVAELIELAREIFGDDLNVSYGNILDGMTFITRADITKAKEVLGFEPKVQLKEGLKRTIKWIKESGLLGSRLIKG